VNDDGCDRTIPSQRDHYSVPQSHAQAAGVAPEYPFYNTPHPERIKVGVLQFCAIYMHAISLLVVADAS